MTANDNSQSRDYIIVVAQIQTKITDVKGVTLRKRFLFAFYSLYSLELERRNIFIVKEMNSTT